jgi:ABC-2 type transport system permease protein
MTAQTSHQIIQQKRHFYLTSTLMGVLILIVVVFSTLIAYRSPWVFDTTAGKVFTLSTKSIQLVKSLPGPVQIIAIYPTGASDPMVTSLLAEYSKTGNNLSVDFVDAELEPTKLARYNLDVTAITNGTLIIRSETRTRLINTADMFQNTSDGNVFLGERQITGAIRYVTAVDMPVVYFVEGHDETSTTGKFSQARAALELDAFNVQTLNLLTSGAVPKDASLLIIVSPKKDLAENEMAALQEYLQKGGKALFLVDAMSTNNNVLSNFSKLLHLFAIDITNNLVVEEDSTAHVTNNKLYLIPGYAYHSITEKLAESKSFIILPFAMGLHTLDFDVNKINVELLLASSARSWMRTNMDIESISKTNDDTQGPIPLAYASTLVGSGYGGGDSRIVVIGNSSFLNQENIESFANRDFFLSCVNWLRGGGEENLISPRVIGADKLIVRGNDFIKLLVICMVIMPLVPFIGALAVWYMRKNQ